MMVAATNAIVETYSRLAREYDDEVNIGSCWGRAAEKAVRPITIAPNHEVILDVGCGTGRSLEKLASENSPPRQWFGIDPAENMRKLATERTKHLPSVHILDGRFERIPLATASVDYLYSIFAFHWTTNLEASVTELGRVLKPGGQMDLFFIGRDNGREFIQATTPIFLRYMGPALLLESAKMRKQLTKDAAYQLFLSSFSPAELSVEECYETYYDSLEGHWAWWVRIEGHFMKMPPERKLSCEREVQSALARLGSNQGVPYTLHRLHVKVRRA